MVTRKPAVGETDLEEAENDIFYLTGAVRRREVEWRVSGDPRWRSFEAARALLTEAIARWESLTGRKYELMNLPSPYQRAEDCGRWAGKTFHFEPPIKILTDGGLQRWHEVDTEHMVLPELVTPDDVVCALLNPMYRKPPTLDGK